MNITIYFEIRTSRMTYLFQIDLGDKSATVLHPYINHPFAHHYAPNDDQDIAISFDVRNNMFIYTSFQSEILPEHKTRISKFWPQCFPKIMRPLSYNPFVFSLITIFTVEIVCNTF